MLTDNLLVHFRSKIKTKKSLKILFRTMISQKNEPVCTKEIFLHNNYFDTTVRNCKNRKPDQPKFFMDFDRTNHGSKLPQE